MRKVIYTRGIYKGLTRNEIIRKEVERLQRLLVKGFKGYTIYSFACASAYAEGVSLDVINWLENNYTNVDVSSEEYLDKLLMDIK